MPRGFNNAGPAAAPDAAETGMPPQDVSADTNASPEEQQLYEQVVANAFLLIYDEKSRASTLKSLEGDGVPIEGLATTAATIAKRTVDSARENGMEISGDVLFQAGAEIVEELADLQREAGIADLSEEQIEGAFLRAADLFREASEADGTVNREAAAADMQAMTEADQRGALDEVLPGASSAAQRFQQGGQG